MTLSSSTYCSVLLRRLHVESDRPVLPGGTQQLVLCDELIFLTDDHELPHLAIEARLASHLGLPDCVNIPWPRAQGSVNRWNEARRA